MTATRLLPQGGRILRYEVPVDGQVHTREVPEGPLFVAARRIDVVEFWAAVPREGLVSLPLGKNPPETAVSRQFLVVGTGHPLPEVRSTYMGTAIAPGGQLVWHLLEVHAAPKDGH